MITWAFVPRREFYVLWTDLSQPPSIRPTSASDAWVWKTFVSFIREYSNISLNFRVVTSKWLLAFIKYAAFSCFGAFFAIINSDKQSKTDCSILVPRP